MSVSRRAGLLGMVALMGGSGALHLVVPHAYRRIVPVPLAARRDQVVAVSGVAELVCAALLAMPPTRRVGAWATAALLVAVFPANVQMAVDGGARGARPPLDSALLAWLRLPLQAPLVAWALALRPPSTRRAPLADV